MAHWSKVTPEEFHNSSIHQSINVLNTQCQVGRQSLSQPGIRERIKRHIKNDLSASFLNSPMAGTELVPFWVDRVNSLHTVDATYGIKANSLIPVGKTGKYTDDWRLIWKVSNRKIQGVGGLPRKSTSRRRLPQHREKQECTPRYTEQKGVHNGGRSEEGREGPALRAVGSGFSDGHIWKGLKQGMAILSCFHYKNSLWSW